MEEKEFLERLKGFFKEKGLTQEQIASMLGVTQPYVNSLFTGKREFGKQQAKKFEELFGISEAWLLTGQGDMLTEDLRSGLRREALKKAQAIMDFERLIPVMTPDELRTFEKLLTGQREAVFSPDTLNSLNERASERVREINAKFAAAAAKSDELCRQRTVKK